MLRLPLLGAGCLLLLAGLSDQSAFAQQGPSPVAVAPIVADEVAAGQTFVGTVVPLKKAIIGSAVDGRVIEFPANAGDRVKAGQPLAQLLTDTISLELEAAEAELTLFQEELAELENGNRPEDVEQARARMEQSKALSEYARTKYERMQRLFREGRAVTEEELEETLSVATSAREKFNESKSAFDLVKAGPRAEKIAQARAKVAQQRAIAERLRDQIKKHTIFSRFDGYVTAEHTEVGQWVSRGQPVAEVVALDQVDVEAYVLEKHVPHVRVGMTVRVEIPALPEHFFTGTVALIVPQADIRARTFPVKVRVENKIENDDPLIKSGMLARVTLPTGEKQQALLVSKDAVVLGGPKPMVFVVDVSGVNAGQGKVRPVPVELGVAKGGLIQVEGELQKGQLVVVQGNERLRPGQDVVIARTLEPDARPQAISTGSRSGG